MAKRVSGPHKRGEVERFHGVFVAERTDGGGSSPTKPPAADDHVSFVAEMESMPAMDAPQSAQQWSDTEKAGYADAIRRAGEEWKKRVPQIGPKLTPDVVRRMSRWSKPQMQQYKAVPALDKVSLQPVGTDAKKEKLVLEGTIDTLPTHHPLVTRVAQGLSAIRPAWQVAVWHHVYDPRAGSGMSHASTVDGGGPKPGPAHR